MSTAHAIKRVLSPVPGCLLAVLFLGADAVAHVPAEVRVGLTPRRAIKFNKCPSKVRTLRVNVQLKHRPEPGKACSPCLQNVTESAMATIIVNLKIGAVPRSLCPPPTGTVVRSRQKDQGVLSTIEPSPTRFSA